MKRVLVLMMLYTQTELLGAFEHLTQGSGPIAMGGASVALRGNPWAAFSNPAGMMSIGDRLLSVSYSPQLFGLKELSRGSLSYLEPTAIGMISASASRFGFDLYREVDFQASFAASINDLLSAGTSLHYYHLSIARYGSSQTLGIDVGVVAELTDQLRWGFAAFNVNAPTIGAAKEKLPQVFTTGLAYSPIPNAILAADMEKDIRYPVELHVGIQYRVLDMLDLRAGTTSEPSVLSAGIGIRYSIAQCDYAFTNHSDLGPTHQFSLSLYLGEL